MMSNHVFQQGLLSALYEDLQDIMRERGCNRQTAEELLINEESNPDVKAWLCIAVPMAVAAHDPIRFLSEGGLDVQQRH